MAGWVQQQAWGWWAIAMPGRGACALVRALVAYLPQRMGWCGAGGFERIALDGLNQVWINLIQNALQALC